MLCHLCDDGFHAGICFQTHLKSHLDTSLTKQIRLLASGLELKRCGNNCAYVREAGEKCIPVCSKINCNGRDTPKGDCGRHHAFGPAQGAPDDFFRRNEHLSPDVLTAKAGMDRGLRDLDSEDEDLDAVAYCSACGSEKCRLSDADCNSLSKLEWLRHAVTWIEDNVPIDPDWWRVMMTEELMKREKLIRYRYIRKKGACKRRQIRHGVYIGKDTEDPTAMSHNLLASKKSRVVSGWRIEQLLNDVGDGLVQSHQVRSKQAKHMKLTRHGAAGQIKFVYSTRIVARLFYRLKITRWPVKVLRKDLVTIVCNIPTEMFAEIGSWVWPTILKALAKINEREVTPATAGSSLQDADRASGPDSSAAENSAGSAADQTSDTLAMAQKEDHNGMGWETLRISALVTKYKEGGVSVSLWKEEKKARHEQFEKMKSRVSSMKGQQLQNLLEILGRGEGVSDSREARAIVKAQVETECKATGLAVYGDFRTLRELNQERKIQRDADRAADADFEVEPGNWKCRWCATLNHPISGFPRPNCFGWNLHQGKACSGTHATAQDYSAVLKTEEPQLLALMDKTDDAFKVFRHRGNHERWRSQMKKGKSVSATPEDIAQMMVAQQKYAEPRRRRSARTTDAYRLALTRDPLKWECHNCHTDGFGYLQLR